MVADTVARRDAPTHRMGAVWRSRFAL